MDDASDPTAPLADIVKTANSPPEPLPSGLSLQTGVDALQAISAAHRAELETTIEANQKNNAVIQALQTTTDQTNNDSISAYENLNKISRLPAGISRVLGFFDDSYNAPVQKNNLDISQVKLQQAAEKAKQQIQINNTDPAIAKLRSDLAQQDFDFQSKAFGLVGTVKGLSQKDTDLRLQATRILLDMNTQQREDTNFKLSGMTLAQKQAELAAQNAGKGNPFWAGKAGLLEHSINVDQQAETARDKAAIELKNNRLDTANKFIDDSLHKIPNYILAPMIADARSSGALFLDLGKGVQAPLSQAETAFIDNKKHEDETVAGLTQESNAIVLQKTGTVGTSLTALAGLDPDANRIFQTYSQALTQYNAGTKDYNTSRAFSAILDDTKTKLQAIAKRVASTAPTAEARSAIEKFGETGTFDADGGDAVVKGITGNYMAQTRTKYSAAMALANKAVADRVVQQDLAGMPAFDSSRSSAAQTQQMMAAIMASKDQKKIADIKDEVLNDPVVQKQMADAMGATIQISTIKSVFNDLAQVNKGTAVWANLRDHPETMNDANGAFSLKKLAAYLAQQSVHLGPNGVNYGQLLAEAMKTRALTSRNNPTPDPNKTIYDHALEAKIYGGNAEPLVLADFAERLRLNVVSADDDMKQKINQDLQQQNAGNSALQNAQLSGMEGIVVPGYGKVEPQILQGELSTAPSATGSGLTRAQIQKLYGSPQPVTTGVGR